MLRRIIAQARTAPVGITTAQRETTIPTPAKRDTQAPTNINSKLNEYDGQLSSKTTRIF